MASVNAPTEDVRLARKRATDRKSQRNHRERRRAYVRDLEDKVAALAGASSSDERVATLLAENEALRVRCQVLTSQLNRIRTIASEARTEPETVRDAEATTPIHTPTATLFHFDSTDEPLHFDDDILDDNADVDLCQTFSSDDAVTTSCQPLQEDVPALPDEPNLSLVAFDFTTTGDASLLDNTFSLSLSCPLPLPQYCPPQGPADSFIQAMVEEAATQHRAGKFDTSTPSLSRLLTQGPTDILSFRLFHYIKRYGAMPLHWLLSIFWVQYLFLRWNVLRTTESYELVPHFLRPTPLECAIPHRLCINMLVWPDIRQALIRDALMVNAEDVSIELLESLSPRWPSSFAMTGDLIATMDVCRMIEVQAVQLDFWKVGPGFLRTYPQYKGCALGVDG